jgi:hypothetical protein
VWRGVFNEVAQCIGLCMCCPVYCRGMGLVAAAGLTGHPHANALSAGYRAARAWRRRHERHAAIAAAHPIAGATQGRQRPRTRTPGHPANPGQAQIPRWLIAHRQVRHAAIPCSSGASRVPEPARFPRIPYAPPTRLAPLLQGRVRAASGLPAFPQAHRIKIAWVSPEP